MPCFLGKFFPLFLPQLSYFRSQLIPNIWMISPVLGGFGWCQFHPSYAASLSILGISFIFFNICLSKIRRLFLPFAVKVQVSDEYVSTGHVNLHANIIIVLTAESSRSVIHVKQDLCEVTWDVGMRSKEVTGGKLCNISFKSRQMGCAVYVVCMGRVRNACKICCKDWSRQASFKMCRLMGNIKTLRTGGVI